MPEASGETLARIFVDVADTLVDEFDLIEFLQMVATHTSGLVDARATGLLLADHHGRLQLMAASDERAEMVELFQVQAVEGPCQDCYRQGRAVSSADLRTAGGRWPRFAPQAVAAGYRSVHAFPMRVRDDLIGALNLFGTQTGPLSPEDARIVQAVANVASIGLVQERLIKERELLAAQLQGALNSRIVIEQAKGALAQIHGTTPDEAFELLRAFCRRSGRRLTVVADDVVHRPGDVPELTTSTGS